ncbi:DUF1731 domain-containing protein [Phragmitibacter flavus]|uniref:DUF1731 domain-containing protein n=1 Tax=Phragmitibacter flavus TaxID=2576071 RepID=A0A5R8KD83_9BACT|nr:NAD-dependent epimerase/dehydratase family protein [Phragmitibacter flavus]TLD70260.1 DUF1731 domain-containing protein [Phragmitibacter flavus]
MFLLIGCGYIGERVADLLHQSGHSLAAVTHSQESAAKLRSTKPYPILTSDVSNHVNLQHLATQLPDAPTKILHCASSNRGGPSQYQRVFVHGCQNLIKTFPDAHLLFTSSTSVYPQLDGSEVTETTFAEPTARTSQLLRDAEQIVLAHHGTVARLAGLYGPHRSFVLKQFIEGTAAIEGNHGEGRCLNQIHREDAARALVHLFNLSPSGIFNVVDQHPLNQRDCYLQLQTLFNLPLPPTTEPNHERKRPWTHKRVSSAKLQSSGFTWRYPSYLDALKNDPELIPSILALVPSPAHPLGAHDH